MEDLLRIRLLDCAARFEAATSLTAATVGKRALNDNTFFARLESGQGFTIRTYDRVIGWFEENWPENLAFPQIPASAPAPVEQGAAA